MTRGWRLDEIRAADRATVERWVKIITPAERSAAAHGSEGGRSSTMVRSAGWKARAHKNTHL